MARCRDARGTALLGQDAAFAIQTYRIAAPRLSTLPFRPARRVASRQRLIRASGAVRKHRIFLKSLERVKGIEPSYSAWKAAALPLSYTRITGSLTRPGGGLNCSGPVFPVSQTGLFPLPGAPLNGGGISSYIQSPETNERR